MSTLKIKRALRLATIGNCPASAAAMLQAVPASVTKKLTSRDLATLLDANWRLAQTSKSLASREAIAEGGVWCASQQRFMELVQ